MEGWDRNDDDLPVRSGHAVEAVSLSRGRESHPEREAATAFSPAQLDQVAPLSPADILALRANAPTERTKDLIRRRIEAARQFKYRGAGEHGEKENDT